MFFLFLVIKKILSDEFKSSPNDGHFERFPNMIPNPVIVVIIFMNPIFPTIVID